MRRTYRRPGRTGSNRKIVIGLVVAAVVGGGIAVGTGLSSASTACDGMDQAIRNNQQFIAAQRANPNSQTEAVIANRQAVIDLINVQKKQAGCGGAVAAPPAPPAQQATKPPATKPPAQQATQPPAAGNNGNNGGGAGQVVCAGSTVTLSGEGGAPAASSGTHPIGTTLRVRNLDNNKSITVKVTSVSGSCVLLNNAAFEEVREPGKFLIRRAVIERVG
ncbi:hypothetical protein Ait01nite_050320 [Actinoplanes italicus]|uniref:Secreted protein n=1 Tax=Actinoplanes italicus TaxID=113567 RepID=A0A2T0KBF2_9ACTN|nr:hypothetical protein [Actinoplanes italicus]PRX20522.1 hypothetical protein CLV67_108323 [Actinoplanes italicus]GIE31987.1 hypothetical protein Ait01nite_050320 [Actinoplanes italicus]